MPNESPRSSRRRLRSECTDPVVGNILAGWRFDISGSPPPCGGDYEQHFEDCASCRAGSAFARSIDILLISVSTLSLVAFLLAAIVIHSVEMITHLGSLHLELHHTAITISLEAVAIAGMAFSALLWLLIAIATPLPGLVEASLSVDCPQRYVTVSLRMLLN